MAKILMRKAAGKLEARPAEAPKNLMDVMRTLAEAIRFGYAETLGKWHLFDFLRAIFYALLEKGKKTVAIECGKRSDCVQLDDPRTLNLSELKRCLTCTMLIFSKKRLSTAILSEVGFTMKDVLKRKETARILKPAYTVIRDEKSKCLYVFIRGTRSLNDMLTDAIAMAAPVSFSCTCNDGDQRKNNQVSGHAHRGMLAAARWIKKRCTPVLSDAIHQYPNFEIKIVGHSLGAGVAALLTYMLREKEEFSSCTCLTFGPAACMTLELAELGKPFITSIIHGSDMVPTLSVSSVCDFIFEVLDQTSSPNLRCSIKLKRKIY